MSERALLLGLALWAAAPLQGQELERLKRHEAELVARLEALQGEAKAAETARFVTGPFAATRVGELVIAYPEWAAGDVAEGLAAALGPRLARYGTALALRRGDTIFVSIDERSRNGSIVQARWQFGAARGEQWVGAGARDPVGWVADIVDVAIGAWVGSLVDPDLLAWAGVNSARISASGLRDPIVRDLVASHSSRARRCLRGADDDCRLLLELGEGGVPRADAYDPADLPGVILEITSVYVPGRVNCTSKRDVAACVELVRRGSTIPPHPVSTRTRSALLAYAIAQGGEGAWLRLRDARGRPLPDQVSAAAGRSVDAVVTGWRRDLIEGRRTTVSGLAPSLLLAVLWSVAAVVLFAWRYQWRRV